jgi:hypothetical protein
MARIVYSIYSLFMIGTAGMASYRGWSGLSVNEVKNVPKTVRDNPGAYRSHYAGYSRYIGGK